MTLETQLRPTTRLASLFFISLLAALLPGCGTTAATELTDDLFERHEIVLDSTERQTVLTGFLLGGAVADVAVARVDENGERRLRIHSFDDGTWTPRLDATLGSEVSFVDIGHVGGRDRLLTYETGRLSWFDPESATERELATVTPELDLPASHEILHLDVTRDVNGDGRDDLVVPGAGGFSVLVQREDGAFAEPVRIGAPAALERNGGTGYRHDPWNTGRVHELDYDRDGRRDLAFWNDDHFVVHLQDEDGLFAPTSTTFTTAVDFDSDDLAWLAAPHGVRQRRTDHEPAGELTGRVLHSLTDMNGDGVADLVVFALEGGSLWKMRSTYEVHFGAAADGGIEFAAAAGAAIHSDGIPFGIRRHDLDDDGQVDVMLTVIEPGVFKAVGMLASALLTRSVALDLDLYRFEDDGYPGKPSASRKSRVHTPQGSGERTLFSPVMIGEVTGDGRSDLLVGWSRDELRVFPGVPGPELFARQPRKVAVAMPEEEYAWLADLDADGRQDVVLHQPSATGEHRVTLLIAR